MSPGPAARSRRSTPMPGAKQSHRDDRGQHAKRSELGGT
jgi:hypothetical protein